MIINLKKKLSFSILAKKIAISLLTNGQKHTIAAFIVDTDYKTKFEVDLELLTVVLGWRVERDAANNIALATTIDGHEFFAKNLNINTDYSTKLEITTIINNKVYGWRVER